MSMPESRHQGASSVQQLQVGMQLQRLLMVSGPLLPSILAMYSISGLQNPSLVVLKPIDHAKSVSTLCKRLCQHGIAP